MLLNINSKDTIKTLCQSLSVEEMKQLNLDLLIIYINIVYVNADMVLQNILYGLSYTNFNLSINHYEDFLTNNSFTNYEWGNRNHIILNIIWKHLIIQ